MKWRCHAEPAIWLVGKGSWETCAAARLSRECALNSGPGSRVARSKARKAAIKAFAVRASGGGSGAASSLPSRHRL